MSDAFNFVAVLVSIVIGLAITNLLSGLSEMVQAANRRKGYWVNTVWIFNIFYLAMMDWWMFYRWRTAETWTFFLFIWVTIPATLIYLSSAILYPGELETSGSPNWHDYYYKNRRGFFLVLGTVPPVDVVDTLLKGWPHFLAQGPFYLPFIGVWAGGALIAAFTRNERYHAVWAIAFPVEFVSYTAINLLKLG